MSMSLSPFCIWGGCGLLLAVCVPELIDSTTPFGSALLWLVAIPFACAVLWHGLQAKRRDFERICKASRRHPC